MGFRNSSVPSFPLKPAGESPFGDQFRQRKHADAKSFQKQSKRNAITLQDILNPQNGRDSSDEEESSPSPSPQLKQEARDWFDRGSCNGTHAASTPATTPEAMEHIPAHPDATVSDVPTRTRDFRPSYDEEQGMFIWFHKEDLGLGWTDIGIAFNNYWPHAPRKISGMQCKLYRLTAYKKLKPIRERKQERLDGRMWSNTGKRYPWMDKYAAILPGYR